MFQGFFQLELVKRACDCLWCTSVAAELVLESFDWVGLFACQPKQGLRTAVMTY